MIVLSEVYRIYIAAVIMFCLFKMSIVGGYPRLGKNGRGISSGDVMCQGQDLLGLE